MNRKRKQQDTSKEKPSIIDMMYLVLFLLFGIVLVVGVILGTINEINTPVKEPAITEIPCTITEMSSDRRWTGKFYATYYYAVFEDDTGIKVRFRIGEELYDTCKQGDTVTILQTVTDTDSGDVLAWALYGAETTTYTLDGYKLKGMTILKGTDEATDDND